MNTHAFISCVISAPVFFPFIYVYQVDYSSILYFDSYHIYFIL